MTCADKVIRICDFFEGLGGIAEIGQRLVENQGSKVMKKRLGEELS